MKKLFTAIAIAALAHCVATAPAKDIPAPAEWLRSNTITPEVQSTMTNNLKWYEGTSLTLEGRAFPDTLTSYSRLAVRHKASVTSAVWINGKASAGVTLRFVSDATSITAQWDCINPMPHMAWTGSGGLDIYYRDKDQWVFCGVGMPNGTSATASLMRENAVPAGPKEFLLFLPLYSPVSSLKLGIAPEFKMAAAPDRYEGLKPIVFYGTSITQGGCASRAGMNHPGLVRRWLDYPVINLGFSGSGKCEPAMADVLAEIPAAVYVIETVSNMTPEMIDTRVVPFLQSLRKKRPDTPIVMFESPNKRDVEANAAWQRAFEAARNAGLDKLDYVKCDELYKGRENPTVDGVHPTDLGFYEVALTYEKVLSPFIQKGKK